MQVTLPNRRTATLTNLATFGDFTVGDMETGRSGIVFNGAYYDDRATRQYAEWCASRFDPEHARRHMKRGRK